MNNISVIIISYNRPEETLETINNVLSLKNENNILNEIIVINNASTVDYSIIENKMNTNNSNINLKYIKSDKNLGVAGGRNLGIKEAHNDGLLFIDDDAIFEDKEVLKKITFLLSKDQNIGILAFLSKNYFTNEINLNEFPHFDKTLVNQKSFYTYYFVGVAHFIKKDVFEKVGYYPEDFFYGMEEYDLSYRALNKGYKILYSNSLKVLHKKVQKGRQPNKFITQKLAENKIKVALRNLPALYVLTHIFLWSLKYLKESKLNFIGLYRIYKNIYEYCKNDLSRNIISKKTIIYIKELNGKITY